MDLEEFSYCTTIELKKNKKKKRTANKMVYKLPD